MTNFRDAYEQGAHRDFVNCDTDEKLANFANRWGPLYWVQKVVLHRRKPKVVTEPVQDIRYYRNGRRTLKAFIELLVVTQQPSADLPSLEECIAEYLASRQEMDALVGELNDRGRMPSEEELEEATKEIYRTEEATPAHSSGLKSIAVALVCGSLSIRYKLEFREGEFVTVPDVDSLYDALYWMVLEDLNLSIPTNHCRYCRKILPAPGGGGKTATKFCPADKSKGEMFSVCAHRWHAREHARNARKALQAQRAKGGKRR